MSVVEACVAGLRQAFWHVTNQFEPHALSAELPGLDARDGLDVSGDAFFDPVVLVLHVWKSEMNHFVGEHPVGVQIVLAGLGADGDSNQATVARKGLTAAHAFAVKRANLKSEMRHRITPVVSNNRVSSFLHPPL